MDGQSHYDGTSREFRLRDPVQEYFTMSPEERREANIEDMINNLQNYVKSVLEMEVTMELQPGMRLLTFLFQKVPSFSSGAPCYLSHCGELIWPGECLIRISDQMSRHQPPLGAGFLRGNCIYFIRANSHCRFLWRRLKYLITGTFHIECFEKFLNLSSPDYALLFKPDPQVPPHATEVSILQECIRRWLRQLNCPVSHAVPWTAQIGTLGHLKANELQEPASLANMTRMWGPTIDCRRYFPPETDPNYDQRHSLSTALDNLWEELAGRERENILEMVNQKPSPAAPRR